MLIFGMKSLMMALKLAAITRSGMKVPSLATVKQILQEGNIGELTIV